MNRNCHIIVRLDDPNFGGGPATVIASHATLDDYLAMVDRDGARDEKLRFWKGDLPVGARTSLGSEAAHVTRRGDRGDWDMPMPKASKTYRVSVTVTWEVEIGDEHITPSDWEWGLRQSVSYYSDGRHNFPVEMILDGAARATRAAAETAVDAFASRTVNEPLDWEKRNAISSSIPIRLHRETIVSTVHDATGADYHAKTIDLPVIAEDSDR